MKVSLSWLKQLVNYNLSSQQLADLLSLKSIGVKEINEDYLELDLTYNRGDLLSLRGVAREVAAITNTEILFEDKDFPKFDLPKTPVKVEKVQLAAVAGVARIEGLTVGPSPKDWIKKLNDCGMRSVNNIADITNLIMLEYGQPLHAFDKKTVKDDLIAVRLATKNEEIRTLDGKLRKLTEEDIVLADTEKSLDVAGVMGGKDTEIKDSTHTILLSASLFNPVMVRKTAKRLGLHSEASKRFQHGLTKTNLLAALSAAIKMYEGLGGKLTAITLVGDLKDQPKTILLTQEKINSLIGMEIPEAVVESSLKSLGFKLANQTVTVPYFRLDINIEEDLVEEVARMYGYEKIPPQELTGNLPEQIDQSLPNFIYDLKNRLKDAGLTEVETYSFYSSKAIFNCQFSIVNLLKVANPISSETQYLRDNLWPNLIEVVAKNFKNGFKDIAIFEIGKVYGPAANGLPFENYRLSIALTNNTDCPIVELQSLVDSLKISTNGQLADKQLFHPTRITGSLAEIHPRVLNKFGLEKRVAILEIDIESVRN